METNQLAGRIQNNGRHPRHIVRRIALDDDVHRVLRIEVLRTLAIHEADAWLEPVFAVASPPRRARGSTGSRAHARRGLRPASGLRAGSICVTSLTPSPTPSVPATMAASSGHARAGRSAPLCPAAAIISGDGMRPAANAADNASPPGSSAATDQAEVGRSAGSASRQRRMASLGGRVDARQARERGRPRLARHGALRNRADVEQAAAGEDFVQHDAERIEVGPLAGVLSRQSVRAPCMPACPRCRSPRRRAASRSRGRRCGPVRGRRA